MVAVALFATTSCTNSGTSDGGKDLQFSIAYSTGEATWSETNPETLVLNKLGVGTTGTIPYLIVTSNTYWTVSVPEEYQEWMSVSPLGGPNPNADYTNVYLTLSENKGETREGEFYFVFASGRTMRVPVKQVGPLTDPTEGLLTFLNDDFGPAENLSVDTKVKFYGFAGEGGEGHSYSGVAVAGDPEGFAFGYAGSDNCYVSTKDSSIGCYEDVEFARPASGGVNVKIDGKGYFTVKNFNTQGKTNFRLAFGAKNSDGKFRTSDLKVWVSYDNENWDVDASGDYDGSFRYNHAVSPLNDWTLNTYEFSIAPNVSNVIYFKFENTSTDLYSIDDINIMEIDHEAEDLFSLIKTGSDIVGFPVTYKLNNLKTTDVKGENWCAYGLILSEESGVYEDGAEIQVADALPTSAHVQFILGTDQSLAKDPVLDHSLKVTSSMPKVTGMYEGDYWLWTFPVHRVSQNTQIACDFYFRATDAGVKYFYFEWAQCTADEYAFAKTNLMVLPDADKRAFYDSLDWQVWEPKSANWSTEPHLNPNIKGITIGSAADTSPNWTGDSPYSDGFVCKDGAVDVHADPDKIILPYQDAMDDGYFFMRLRCTSNVTCGPCNSTNYQRINRTTHNGTNYLSNSAVYRFHQCGEPQPYSNVYRILGLIQEIDGYTGANPVFTNKAELGVYAGSTTNMRATTTGNNTFVGSCEVNETGKAIHSYYPYNALNGGDPESVQVAVPVLQQFTNGALVADAAAFVQTSPTNFKTTTAIRDNLTMQSSLLELDIHINQATADKISRIEVEGQGIAGSYNFDLTTATRTTAASMSNKITSTTETSIAIPTDRFNPIKAYIPLWDGTKNLTVKIFVGAYYYVYNIEQGEFVANKVSAYAVNLSELEKIADPDAEISGISNAAKFLEFVTAVKNGATGSALDSYRNIDGDLGFGGAEKEEDKVIDFAELGDYDMANWPQITLTENFNGGGYTIKNLTIDKPNISLFKNIEYGYTISNFKFDESCKLIAKMTANDADANGSIYWALLVNGGVISSTDANHVPTGSIEYVDTYATIDVSGEMDDISHAYAVAALTGRVSGAKSDTDVPSRIYKCNNYGKLYFHNITQNQIPGYPYYRYLMAGSMCAHAAAMEVTECNNYGDIVLEQIDRKWGTMFIGGLVGYACNRSDNTNSALFGNVNNCINYGNIYAGQEGTIRVHSMALCGVVARTQWCNLDKLTNNGNIKVNVEHPNVFDGYSYKYSSTVCNSFKDWITAVTNSINFISIGGVFGFSQCNNTTGESNTRLNNTGDITVVATMEGTESADNTGIGVGGVMGIMGANAYNPHFDSCSNSGNIDVTVDKCDAEVCVGGVMGKFASNRYTASYIFYINGSSNVGKVALHSANPTEVIGHVGGIAGSVIYGEFISDVNAGVVTNECTGSRTCQYSKYTGEYENSSATGSIIGTKHVSSIATACTLSKIVKIESAAVGGTVNGVVLNTENFSDYILGNWQDHPTYHIDLLDVKDCTYFNY